MKEEEERHRKELPSPTHGEMHRGKPPRGPDPCKRACDVEIEGEPYQVKRLRSVLGWAYKPLEQGVKAVLVRADGKPWLAILPGREYLEMLTGAGEDIIPPNAKNAAFDHVADTGRSQSATQAFLSKQRVGKS